jgi:hypothetical protein
MKVYIVKNNKTKCCFCKSPLEIGERGYKNIGDVVCTDCVQDYVIAENEI